MVWRQIKNTSFARVILPKKHMTMADPPPPPQPTAAQLPTNTQHPTNPTSQKPLQEDLRAPPQQQISPSNLDVDVDVPSRRTPSSATASQTSTLTPSICVPDPTPDGAASPKRPRTTDVLLYKSPSLNKPLLDFSERKSDKISLHLGLSGSWTKEEGAIEATIAAQNAAEDEIAAAMVDDAAIPMVAEWEKLAEEGNKNQEQIDQ